MSDFQRVTLVTGGARGLGLATARAWVRTAMGSPEAPLDDREGCRSSVMFAMLGKDGPTGGFFHEHETVPW